MKRGIIVLLLILILVTPALADGSGDNTFFSSIKNNSFIKDLINFLFSPQTSRLAPLAAPTYTNMVVNPASGITYSPDILRTFSIQWDDSINGIDTVWIEINYNFGEDITNTTVPLSSGNIYSGTYNFSFTNAGAYQYKWYANNTLGETTDTGSYSLYFVPKANSEIEFLFDGVEGNLTVGQGSIVNLTGILITGNTSADLILYNGTKVSDPILKQGITPLEYLLNTDQLGTFTFSLFSPATTNYESSIKSYSITVEEFADTTNPYYDNLDPPGAYTSVEFNQTHNFAIDWYDDVAIDTVWIEHDFTGTTINETIPLDSGNTYLFNPGLLDTGNYQYKWYANDTSGNLNQTSLIYYQVNSIPSEVDLTLNGISDNITVGQGDIVNITATLIKGDIDNIQIRENQTDLLSEGVSPLTYQKTFLNTGLYVYTAYYNALPGGNYTTSAESYYVNVTPSKLDPNIDLYINGVNGDNTAVVGETVNISGIINQGEGNLELYDDSDSLISEGPSPLDFYLIANNSGEFNFTLVHPETANYNYASETHKLIVSVNDYEAPWYENIIENPVSKSMYSPGKNYTFKVDWYDNFGIDRVWFEFEKIGVGTLYNDTINSSLDNTYSITMSDLNAGKYYYKMCAEDESSNTNCTPKIEYWVSSAIPKIRSSVNGLSFGGFSRQVLSGDVILKFESLNPIGGQFYISCTAGYGTCPFDYTLQTNPINLVYNFSEGYYTIDSIYAPTDTLNYQSTEENIQLEVTNTISNEQNLSFQLYEGVNTISLPLLLSDYSIESIFGDVLDNLIAIYSYKPSTGWQVYSTNPKIPNTLTELNYKQGYFIQMNQDEFFTLSGNLTNETGQIPQIDLEPGWNFIGLNNENLTYQNTTLVLNTTNINYSSIWSFDYHNLNYNELSGSDYFEPGNAYWIYVQETGETPRYEPPVSIWNHIKNLFF